MKSPVRCPCSRLAALHGAPWTLLLLFPCDYYCDYANTTAVSTAINTTAVSTAINTTAVSTATNTTAVCTITTADAAINICLFSAIYHFVYM